MPAGIEPREVEQVGRELRQALHLLAHGRDELPPRRLVELLVVEQLEEAAEREERRPELVGGVRDELAPRAVEVLEADAHALERSGELPELVVPAVDDRLVEAAAGDAVGRTLEAPDSPGVHGGGGKAEHERDHESDQPGEDQPPLDELDARERVGERVAQQDVHALAARHRQTQPRRTAGSREC